MAAPRKLGLRAAPSEPMAEGDLVLSRYKLEDQGPMVLAINESLYHLRPWMPWAQVPATAETVGEFLGYAARAWDDRREFGYVMRLQPGGDFVGGCGLHPRSSTDVLEIGYWVHIRHVGRGLATSASRLLTTAAFELPQVVAVEIHHDKANARSARVPTRLGFRKTGEAPDEVTSPGEIGVDCTWRMEKERWPDAAQLRQHA
jgi:ribosomal-protein-serine acetyltransferase